MESWEISLVVSESCLAHIESLLEDYCHSVNFSESDGSVCSGKTRHSVDIRIYTESREQADHLINDLKVLLRPSFSDDFRLALNHLGTSWRTNWHHYFEGFRVSERLMVRPAWDINSERSSESVIYLNSELAFGIGSHETTQLCLEEIDHYRQKLRGIRALDIGFGTGILSFALSFYGAKTVDGIEVDEESLSTAEENARLNSIVNCNFTLSCLDSLDSTYDLIVANMLSSQLRPLFPQIARKVTVGTVLIFSGFLTEEQQMVEEEILNWFPSPKSITWRNKNGWGLVTIGN